MKRCWQQIGFVIAAAVCCATVAMAQEPLVKVFHPAGPLISYEVATIKPADPNQQFSGTTLRRYIASAYGVPMPWGMMGSEYKGAQVLGGPSWIDSDKYQIKSKAPDELREAMQKMPADERQAQTRTMDQSLLADRFHLKVHFETREMQVFELVPAKSGLKIAAVDPPPANPTFKPMKPGDPMPAGMIRLMVKMDGSSTVKARAATMQALCNLLRGQSPEIAGRPIVDMTGFKGNFDLKDFQFLGQTPPNAGGSTANTDSEAPSLSRALEEKLGIKLVPRKAPVEVVVIDSIDRPTEN